MCVADDNYRLQTDEFIFAWVAVDIIMDVRLIYDLRAARFRANDNLLAPIYSSLFIHDCLVFVYTLYQAEFKSIKAQQKMH